VSPNLTVHIIFNFDSQAERKKMTRILITDAVDLVGAYIIKALLSSSEFQSTQDKVTKYSILVGYHSSAELDTARQSAVSNDVVHPVLVDWADEKTFNDVVKNADAVLLLTPFTSKKVAQISAWMTAIEQAEKPMHIVHVGVHTDETITARPPHETWNLEAEQLIRSKTSGNTRLSATFLRINFDGYNTLLRPGNVAYHLPRSTPYGWMAREDIAAFAARILLNPTPHTNKVHILSAQSISIDDMASNATSVMGFPVSAKELSISTFETMALEAQPGDEGYANYIHSVVNMFSGLQDGRYAWHKQIFPEEFEAVVKRKPLDFSDWLKTSPTKSRLMPSVEGS
jgi:uncharacterized protein YbjT (DUF2867 family)